MLQSLSDRERAVVETIRMRLSEKLAMAHLKGSGFEMSIPTWYRLKKKLKESEIQRLNYIAWKGFEEQHLERIDQLELIQKEMWLNYHLCKDPYKRVIILEKIGNVQPYLSAVYDATKEIATNQHAIKRPKSKSSDVSESGNEEPNDEK